MQILQCILVTDELSPCPQNTTYECLFESSEQSNKLIHTTIIKVCPTKILNPLRKIYCIEWTEFICYCSRQSVVDTCYCFPQVSLSLHRKHTTYSLIIHCRVNNNFCIIITVKLSCNQQVDCCIYFIINMKNNT